MTILHARQSVENVSVGTKKAMSDILFERVSSMFGKTSKSGASKHRVALGFDD